MNKITRVINPLIRQIHDAYHGVSGRNELAALAIEIGNLPVIRRMVCGFDNRRVYPHRPMITLHEGHPSIYLLGWREGDATDIHDHGPCEVGIYCIQGVVTEDLYATLPTGTKDRQPLLAFSRSIRAGDLATCPEQYIHAFRNIHPETAATLHVYGPSLEDMNLYEMKNGLLKFKEHWHDEHNPQH